VITECLLFPKADVQIGRNWENLGSANGQKRTHSVKSLFPVVTGYFFFGQPQEAGCVIVENVGLLFEA
jgi:hypothetical protein